jgi:8-oxo-dGTP diphosphatase
MITIYRTVDSTRTPGTGTGRKVTPPWAVRAAYGGPMALHDGNGWVECRCGQRHWGRHGAAGLLVARPGVADVLEVLLQLRAGWTHQGGSWALPGGARDSHEDVVTAALREAHEEAGLEAAALRVVGRFPGVDHGDWSYTYVVALAGAGTEAVAATSESEELRWVRPADVSGLALHPAFGAAWPALWPTIRPALDRPTGVSPDPRGVR